METAVQKSPINLSSSRVIVTRLPSGYKIQKNTHVIPVYQVTIITYDM